MNKESVEKSEQFVNDRTSRNKQIKRYKISGSNHYMWKGGKPKCLDCGRLTTQYTSKRCHPCYLKSMKGERAPTFGKKWKVRDTSKMSLARIKVWSKSEDRKKQQSNRMSGSNNPKWIENRLLLAKRQERNDMAYKEWRRQVWLRDNFKCKIANQDCRGRLEAHHILGWTEHPELRYEVNNGITLCHAHHPRKRAEEKRLSPYFQELVSVSKIK